MEFVSAEAAVARKRSSRAAGTCDTQNPANAYVAFDAVRMGDTAPTVHFDFTQGATVVAMLTSLLRR